VTKRLRLKLGRVYHERRRTLPLPVADEYPKRLKRMVNKWESMAKQYNAIPWPRGGQYSQQNMK
jgi:hypothetical protein